MIPLDKVEDAEIKTGIRSDGRAVAWAGEEPPTTAMDVFGVGQTRTDALLALARTMFERDPPPRVRRLRGD